MNQPLPQDYDNPKHLLKRLHVDSEGNWAARGQEMALNLFHDVAKRVPAYKDFLSKNDVNPADVKTIDDFKNIPTVDKDNYLRRYSRADLCWDGKFSEQNWMISATSGSTGEPFYFPRQPLQDKQYALTAELYLLENFDIDKKRTLYINAFPLGIWIGGLFTYEAIYEILLKPDYQLSLANPGINIPEVIKTVRNLGKDFDQVIIGAYGPFLKDIIDEGIEQGIVWKDYNPGFVLSAEAFSELFRDYVYEKTGVSDVYRRSLNHYGTVDLGTMSHETPACLLTRRLALQNEKLYQEIFPQTSHLPTLTQYMPEMFYFEDMDGNLLCTANSGIPLVRYDLKDRGRVIALEELGEAYGRAGLNLDEELKKAKIDQTLWQLPFVYVYERSDFSVSFFAFQIYPATIRKALFDTTLQESLTGKFTMKVDYDAKGVQHFYVHVEMKHGTQSSQKLSNSVADKIIEQLLEESSEYRKVFTEYGKERVMPEVTLWPYQDPTYFRSGGKQKWVVK